MNERIGNNKIYALAKEAGLIEFEQFAWNPELGSPTYESVVKARKFAELIVRECLNKIDEVGYKSSNNISTEDTELFKSVLKSHFGVKE